MENDIIKPKKEEIASETDSQLEEGANSGSLAEKAEDSWSDEEEIKYEFEKNERICDTTFYPRK